MSERFTLRPRPQDVKNLFINEATLRESAQAVNPLLPEQALVFTPASRKELAALMIGFGVEQIEIGVPHDPYALDSAKEIVDMAKHSRKTRVAIHCRCDLNDIDAFFKTGADAINLYIGTSKENRNGNGGKTIEEIAQKAKRAITTVRETDNSKFVRFSTEDAFRTKWKDLSYVIGNVYPMVNAIGLPDTVGLAYPDEVFNLIKKLRRFVNDAVIFEFHGHNDRGNSIINALAALRAGANIIDTSILGYGERNGITSLNGLLSELANPDLLPILQEKYDIKKLNLLTQIFSRIVEIPIPHDQPLVTVGAVRHVAGVHTKADDVDHQAYLSIDPSAFGLDENRYSLVASSTVGGNRLQTWARQNLNIDLSPEQAKEAANQVRQHAFTYGPITEDTVRSLVLSYCKNKLVG